MLATVRMFESAETARRAIDKLKQENLVGEGAWLIAPASDRLASEIVADAISAEQLPGYFVHAARRALERGHTVVAVKPVFGVGRVVEETLDEFGTVGTDELPEYRPSNASPLSDLLGWPTLTSYQYTFNAKQITSGPWFLTAGRDGSSLLAKPKPFLGDPKLIKPKANWRNSMGFPMLAKPKPFLGDPKLIRPSPERRSSFGFPLLSKNPTPLSSLFNLPLLSRTKDDDRS